MPPCLEARVKGLGECARAGRTSERTTMIWTIAAILLALWVLGMTSAYTLAGFLHVLLVVAVVLVLFNVILGRRPSGL